MEIDKMRQILKYGIYNVITCTDCKCEYTFSKTDVDEKGNVKCPCCDTDNTAPVAPSKE